MGRTKEGRKNGSGTLEKRGDIWLARWTVNGKRYTRSTGCKVSGGKKAKEQAERRLDEFTAPYKLGDEKRIIEVQIARLGGVEKEIGAEEAKKPSLKLVAGFSAFLQSQSRPRSGAATLHNYELQYFQFVDWASQYHGELSEMRQVDSATADEYSRFLLSGTPKKERDQISAARKWLHGFDWRQKRDGGRVLSKDEEEAIKQRRALAARTIRNPVRGATFNKHLNALALIWRHVARNAEARISVNPWAYDEETGRGIRRVSLTHAERPHARRALSLEEVYNLLNAATGELRALVAIGFYTGLRLGDAATLEWGNIDQLTGIITVRSRKTDTETRAAVHPVLARILEAETKARRGYVLPNTARLYLSGKSGRVQISNEITGLFESVGIVTKFTDGGGRRARSECGFHSLRHTFVTALRAHGATLRTAQELAGHNTQRMTEHYTHEDGRAVLALPDITQRTETDAPQTATEGNADARRAFTVEELRAAIAGLSPEERAALIGGDGSNGI